MKTNPVWPGPWNHTPAWTGLLSGLLSILCFFLPCLETDSQTYSFYQMYHTMGADFISWAFLAVSGLAALLSLLGFRGSVEVLGLMLVEYHAIILGAMCLGIGIKPLLTHLRAGAWGGLAGAVGLAANTCFFRLDRRIFTSLLAFWCKVDP